MPRTLQVLKQKNPVDSLEETHAYFLPDAERILRELDRRKERARKPTWIGDDLPASDSESEGNIEAKRVGKRKKPDKHKKPVESLAESHAYFLPDAERILRELERRKERARNPTRNGCARLLGGPQPSIESQHTSAATSGARLLGGPQPNIESQHTSAATSVGLQGERKRALQYAIENDEDKLIALSKKTLSPDQRERTRTFFCIIAGSDAQTCRLFWNMADGRPENEVIWKFELGAAKGNGIDLLAKDIERLSPTGYNTWFTDNIVLTFFEALAKEYPQFSFTSPFFILAVRAHLDRGESSTDQSKKRVTERWRLLFQKERIFIRVHVCGCHWVMLVVSKRRILCIDSFATNPLPMVSQLANDLQEMFP